MARVEFTVKISRHPDAFKSLKYIIEAAGGTCELVNNDRENSVLISYDEFEIKRKSNRFAGHKKNKPVKSVSYGEIKKMLATMTQKDVAIELGYSFRTFTRRLKQAKEEEWEDWKYFY